MRTFLITLIFGGLLWTSCSRQPPTGPSVFQLRLVENGPTADTEPLTVVQSLTDASRTTPETLNVRKQVLLDQRAVSSATMQTQAASPAIEVVLTDEGRKAFANITRQSVGKRLAIVVDGKLLVAPRIEAEIPGGRAFITGSLSVQQASELAAKINDGVKK